jgi:hypothetical protein
VTDHDVVDGELIGEELVRQPHHAITLFHTDDPAEVVERATRTAQPLAKAVRDRKLSVQISGREHVKVEGWALLGSMLGVFPYVVWTRKLENGWEARVEARTLAGQAVGAAEAQCLRDEAMWSYEPVGKDGRKLPPRDDSALRSMAQTRATSKALRMPLGFVMQLAGFDPTPAEEMPRPSSSPHQAADAAVISDSQRRRLRAIQNKAQVTDERLRELVREIAGVDSSKDIPRDVYDYLCDAVEAEGQPF